MDGILHYHCIVIDRVEDLDSEDTVIHGLDCHSDVYLGVAGRSSRHCCWALEGHLDMPYNLFGGGDALDLLDAIY